MTTFLVGIKIWLRAVLLNGISLSICSIPQYGNMAVMILIIGLALGYFISSPLIIVTGLLTKAFVYLPFRFADKFAWLQCMLVFIAAGIIYILVSIFLPELLPHVYLVVCAATLATLLAGLWTKAALKDLDHAKIEL